MVSRERQIGLALYLEPAKEMLCTTASVASVCLHVGHVPMSLSLTSDHIVFDECHKAKNLVPTGSSKPSKTGLTVLQLQKKLPKARIVYCSATGRSTTPPESNTASTA